MKLLIFLLLLSGCSIELKHQRELQSLSNLAAERCTKNLKDNQICASSINCLDQSIDGVRCYNNYRARLKKGIKDEGMKMKCDQMYQKAKEVCK
jgi:hypothetical protein